VTVLLEAKSTFALKYSDMDTTMAMAFVYFSRRSQCFDKSWKSVLAFENCFVRSVTNSLARCTVCGVFVVITKSMCVLLKRMFLFG
jgi:hypothetical protein